MKKFFGILLALIMLVGCTAALADPVTLAGGFGMLPIWSEKERPDALSPGF